MLETSSIFDHDIDMSKNISKPETNFSDLKAIYLNCTLKKSAQGDSHTQRLIAHSANLMRKQNVAVHEIRVVEEGLATGVYPDMTEHKWDADNWPNLWKIIEACDIIIIATPIWLGAISSVCMQLIERLYAMSSQMNDKGQFIYYGKVGGCLITGNEDGVKHCSMQILYSLMHIGCTIPPQADAGWIGDVGPGLSYGDKDDKGEKAGFDNDFTNRNTTFMTWNLLHAARMLKDAGGIEPYGNSNKAWKDGQRFEYEISK